VIVAGGRSRELRIVAAIEALKGLLVLIAAGLFFHLLHGGVQGATEALVRHFHLDPARHYPGVFIATVIDFGNAHKLILSLGALFYAGVRFIEAWGLWHTRSWAWGFGLIAGALYIPLELAELAQHVSWAALSALGINVAVVFMLWQARTTAK
jgi:uncharacterized membrane protein (DUF2068 family)